MYSFVFSLIFVFFLIVYYIYEKRKFQNEIINIHLYYHNFIKKIPNPLCIININHQIIFSNPEFIQEFAHNSIGQELVDYLSSTLQFQDVSAIIHEIKEIASYKKSYVKLVVHLNECEERVVYIHLDYYLQNFQAAVEPKIILIFYPIYLINEKKNQQNLLIKKFDLITSYAPIAMWCRDHEGNLNHVNMVYANAFSKDPATILDQQYELIGASSTFNPRTLALQALHTQKKHIVTHHGIIAGHRRFLEIYECPVKHDQIGTVGYAIDITPQEEAHDLLGAYIRSQRELHDLLSTAIAIFNSKGQLDFFNAAFLKMFKFDESWLYTHPLLMEVLDNLRQRRKAPEIENFNEYKKQKNYLFKNIMEPVHELWYLSDGVNLKMTISPEVSGGLIFLFEDVSDKMALEQGYNTLIAVQRETIDHLYEGILVIGSDFRIRLFNPSFRRIWTIDESACLSNMHLNDLYIGYFHDRFRTEHKSQTWYQSTQSSLIARTQHKREFFLKDKKIQYTYLPLPDGSNLLRFADISDRWLFEKSIKEKNDNLEQTYHLKTEFISHIAYEFKSPLNTISGFTDIMINQYFGSLNERQLDYCIGICNASQRLTHLMGDLIDLANIQAGQFKLNYQEINLDLLLRNVVDMVHHRAKDNGIQIAVFNQTLITTFRGDETCFKHAIFNLLNNAIHFTLSGGKILLHTNMEVVKDQNYLKIIIRDNGTGISQEEKRQVKRLLATDLQTTNIKNYSTVLSIALAKTLIELHHGFLTFDYRDDHSSSITCYIPISLL